MIMKIKNSSVVIDKTQYQVLSRHSWCLDDYGYARRTMKRNGKATHLLMHHAVIGKPEKGMVVDHRNGNPRDNRRCNLRFVSSSTNRQNSKIPSTNKSGFRGVCWNKGVGKWQAQIQKGSKNYYLGLYDTPEKASMAYKKKHKELCRNLVLPAMRFSK
jgi:hypothetical protein